MHQAVQIRSALPMLDRSGRVEKIFSRHQIGVHIVVHDGVVFVRTRGAANAKRPLRAYNSRATAIAGRSPRAFRPSSKRNFLVRCLDVLFNGMMMFVIGIVRYLLRNSTPLAVDRSPGIHRPALVQLVAPARAPCPTCRGETARDFSRFAVPYRLKKATHKFRCPKNNVPHRPLHSPFAGTPVFSARALACNT